MKTKHKILIGLVFVLLVFLGIAAYVMHALAPRQTNVELTYEVKPNATLQEVLQDLEKAKLIKNSQISYFYARTFKKITLISGKFKLNSNDSVETILNQLGNAKNLLHDDFKVTLIDGKWAIHYALALEEKTGIKKELFIQQWNNKAYIQKLQTKYWFLPKGLENKQVKVLLEGFLAPDTYFFSKTDTVETITEKILDNTKKRLDQFKDQLQDKDIFDVMIKASLVQYEASELHDMRKIAYITEQRLNKKMKLQYSVTVCYALYDRLSDWKQCETNIEIDSKYNTYKYEGLPPGPIDNPSLKAIEAVLNPEKNDYLFFVADVCHENKVYYSKTFEEHEQLVQKHLRDTSCLP